MKCFTWFLLGAVSLGSVIFAIGVMTLLNASGFSASEPPGKLERWAARMARSAALPSAARARTNPVANAPEVLAVTPTTAAAIPQLGKRTYPPAPDMRLPATQEMTDGELLYVIENG